MRPVSLDDKYDLTKKQIFVAVQKAISNPNDPLFDIPNTSFAVDGSSLYLMVAHRRLHAIARIEIPSDCLTRSGVSRVSVVRRVVRRSFHRQCGRSYKSLWGQRSALISNISSYQGHKTLIA